MVGFLVRCFVYWGVALFLISRVPAIERAGIDLTVATIEKLFEWTGQAITRQGNALFGAGAAVEIVADCSPHVPYFIFAAVVLAFPSSWTQRLIGLVAGAVLIHVFNTVRILALMWVLAWRREWFEFAHVYLWQTGTILVLFAAFALWLRLVSARRPAPARSTPGGAP
jgi:exosortase/archaeosortase family protein